MNLKAKDKHLAGGVLCCTAYREIKLDLRQCDVLCLPFKICMFSTATKGLVTNYGEGGSTKREGGAREVLPLRKGGGGKF